MALSTGFGGRFDEARWIQSAVRVVAIRTLHQPLGHSMMNGLRELTLYGQVTRVAQLRLCTLHQTVFQPPNLFRSLGNLEKMRLGQLHVTTALIFHLINQMACVAIGA
jgi:hypothetical protein